MTREFVIAGFGGQGVLTAGMVLAYSAAAKDYDATWIPAYGSEMRGGTANCTVKISDDEVSSPFPKRTDILVAMNAPSLHKFLGLVRPGGCIVVNSSIVRELPAVEGVRLLPVAANEIAEGLDNARSANLCALGAAVAADGDLLTLEDLEQGVRGYFSKLKSHDANLAVLGAGYQAVRELLVRG